MHIEEIIEHYRESDEDVREMLKDEWLSDAIKAYCEMKCINQEALESYELRFIIREVNKRYRKLKK